MWDLIKLLLPISLGVAEAGGGAGDGGGEGDGDGSVATGVDHFAEMRAEQEAKVGMAAASAAAGDGDGGETEGDGDGADGAGGAGGETGAETTAAKPETGGQPQYVPKERFDEVLGQLKDLKTELEAIKKGGTQTQQQAEPAWKSQLKPLPQRAGKMVDGKLTEWDTYEEYMDARQDVLNHNARVEADGKAAEAKAKDEATAATQKAQQEFDAWRKNHVEKTIPDFCKAEGITPEAYQAALAKAPSIPILDQATGDSVGMAIQRLSKDAARFTYAVSTASVEQLTPYAAEIMAAAPGPARTAKIIEVVGRMDALLTHGLGLDGKPRGASGALTSGGDSARGGASNGAGGAGGTQKANRGTTVVTSTEGGGGAGVGATATGNAHFNQMRAEQQRKQNARLAGLKR